MDEAKVARTASAKTAAETGEALSEAMAALEKAEKEGTKRAASIASLQTEVYCIYKTVMAFAFNTHPENVLRCPFFGRERFGIRRWLRLKRLRRRS